MVKPSIFGKHDENTLDQMYDVSSRASRSALMADGHFGYVMPIGGVAAYDYKVSVVGVGFDIACGNAAIKTNLKLDDIKPHLQKFGEEIFNSLSFGVGLTNTFDDAPSDHILFDADCWDIIPFQIRDPLIDKARKQLGTIGGGNHYVDVFYDEDETVWVGVHFGSRGLGHSIASNFLALSQGERWGKRGKEAEVLLDLDNPIGADYWALMNLCGEYAYAGREWVARKVVSILGGKEVDLVHNNHNFAWLENHFSTNYVVVRKGATPARPGQRGFVGGSMGECSVILQGALEASPEVRRLQQLSLYSTVHGAGRVMGRMDAKGKYNRQGECIRAPRVDRRQMDMWLSESDVLLFGGDVDEAPQVYKRLSEVLLNQRGTVEVLHTLHPVIVCMAPGDVRDPYKD